MSGHPRATATTVTRKAEGLERGASRVDGAAPEALAVLPVKGVERSDLGDPARVDALRSCAAR